MPWIDFLYLKVLLRQFYLMRLRKMVKISATLARQLTGKKQHKYNAKATECLYKHRHDSKKEAEWCLKLHQLQKEGKITLLHRQPKFELKVNGIHIADHYPDFSYYAWVVKGHICQELGGPVTDFNGLQQCIVEVKGAWEGGRLPVWKIKYKLMQALYPEVNYQVV
jgi:hypothetical protein